MKLKMEPIDVAVKAEQPQRFCWRGKLYVVESVIDTWTWRGRWWMADIEGAMERDDKRDYYLLMTDAGVVEIFAGNEGWMLSRISD